MHSTARPHSTVAPQVESLRGDRLTLLAFLERLEEATSVMDVVMAAGIARQELLGVPYEPYPAVA